MIHEDDELVAFKDINPQAPVHFLIVPKKHFNDHFNLEEKDSALIGRAHLLANKLAKEMNLGNDGFRLVINCKERAGQTVNHLHVHVLGGRDFHWPPG